MKTAAFLKRFDFQHTAKTLRYSLYVITHPLDGFWDLTHENRGSVAAANIIIAMAMLTRVFRLQFTSFLFMKVIWEHVNLIEILLGFLIPIVLACVANWALTTLFDGKGTMKQIHMGIGYALTPYVLIQFPMIFISNLMTVEEGAFYSYILIFSEIWCGMLIISAVMMIHDYTLGKTLITIAATVLGMILIIFIFLLFFSLVTDAAAYFISLYKEIIFRFY
ncbi:YIP1 family protein [Anaerocolumna sp. AGMB13020]|uniref:YIP1 family protein n=1 Tax=Anaerocolumna sp. AGMB13020 TaxID=3081750 RepID=UPI0029558142|nr:YIP1 family protein [Anaerocolumna sp. AGMB13020]WOO38283.1 YIP1 family protein [Anaerocolumna sp. AGMB13020]